MTNAKKLWDLTEKLILEHEKIEEIPNQAASISTNPQSSDFKEVEIST
jgi:hypothetical protein